MKPPFPDQVLDRVNRSVSGRDLGLLNRRPDTPRNFTSPSAGLVTWEEPKELANITHYIVRDGSESDIFAKVGVGQTQCTGLSGPVAFLSSFNEKSGLESIRTSVSGVTKDVGVASIIAGNGIAVSSATGDVTVSGKAIYSSVSLTGGGSYALTNGFTDIPGCTITATVTGKYRITADILFAPDGIVDGSTTVQLLVNGVAHADTAICYAVAPTTIPGSKTWVGIAVTNGQIVKLQGKKNAGAGASAIGIGTSLKIDWLGA